VFSLKHHGLRCLLLVGLSAQPLAAESPLTWQRTEIELAAPPLAEKIEADFVFTNSGTQPVSIAEVHSSCGCTVPELEKRTFAPGESGRLRAVFTFGDRTGQQEKTITVATAAPSASTSQLTLRVHIPLLYDVSPFFVVWTNAEPTTPKQIQLRLEQAGGLRLESVASQHANFSATAAAVPGQPGQHTITIVPTTTDTPTNGVIHLTLRGPNGATRMVTIYALVRSPSAQSKE